MIKRARIAAGFLAGLMVLGSAGCGKETGGDVSSSSTTSTATKESGTTKETESKAENTEPLKLSIMLPYGTNEHDNEEMVQKFRKQLQDYTNTEIEWIFYDQDMYYQKLTLLFATGDLPSILVSDKSAEFINAVNNDTFWDLTDYIDDYDNLKQMSETVKLNASINGKLYGIPRSRTLARNGVGYRLDWLNNLGLKEPETIEEFYDMLVAFTNNDPDGNGKNDTYGLGVSSFTGTWDIMQTWFGVPNKWGIDEHGDLIPEFLTEEYDTALKWFRKIYSEGLVNPDFASVATADWDTILRGGQAGASADVLDRFRRNQSYFDKEGIPAETMLIGAMDAGEGIRCLPTSGYAQLLAISKSKVKTEEELKHVLSFLNALGDAEMLDLFELGYENVTYKMSEEGYAVILTEEEKTALGVPTADWRKGYNQLLPYWTTEEETAKRLEREPVTMEVQLLEQKLYKDNEQYCIPNYGAPYISQTYVDSGAELDKIISEARLNYIQGIIDDVGLQEAKEQWKRSGGEQVIKEVNELYDADANK